MKNVQFYLIEDDESTRRSLINVFNTLGYLLQTFSSAEAFLELKSMPQRSVVITDVCMQEISGIELQNLLKKKYPQVPVIIISGECTVKESVIGMKQGAVEFLLKPFNLEDFIKALESAVNYQNDLIESDRQQDLKKQTLSKLANREREVADLMVAGYKNQAIANQLGISSDTVKQYRANVLAKLNMKDLAELISFYKR
jgi:RNA polymerase sigma factor (sigma-70 family)